MIAGRANELLDGASTVHPNDEVNFGQSSNDVIPTAIHLAAVAAITEDLLPALGRLGDALAAKADEFAGVVKSGRTHLMDATPVTLGQEFGGYATQVRKGATRLTKVLPELEELALGGTAVGTGLNAPEGFAAAVIADMAGITGYPLPRGRRPLRGPGRQGRRGQRLRDVEDGGRSRCSRSPTTCAGWAAAPAPGSPRSGCRRCSPARRSCRARSTR